MRICSHIPVQIKNPSSSKEEKTLSRKEIIKFSLLTIATFALPLVAAHIWDKGRQVVHLRNFAINEYSQCLVDIETQTVDPNPRVAETLKSMQEFYDKTVERANASLHPYFYYASAITTLAIGCITNYLMTEYEGGSEDDKSINFTIKSGLQFLGFALPLNLLGLSEDF